VEGRKEWGFHTRQEAGKKATKQSKSIYMCGSLFETFVCRHFFHHLL